MYALKHNNLVQFEQIVLQLRESRWANDEILLVYRAQLVAGIRRALAVTRQRPDLGVAEEFIDRLERYIGSDPVAFFRRCVKPRQPLATLCHGDYLRNNIAFKFDVSLDKSANI